MGEGYFHSLRNIHKLGKGKWELNLVFNRQWFPTVSDARILAAMKNTAVGKNIHSSIYKQSCKLYFESASFDIDTL